MGAMPAGRKRVRFLGFEIDDIDSVLPETERGLERFDEPGAGFLVDRDPVLNDLDARAEPQVFPVGVGADDFAVEPDPEVALLLEEGEKISRLGLQRHGDPEGDQARASG